VSGLPPLRQTDKAVPEERARETLLRDFGGRLRTVGVDGWPYVVPLLYVCVVSCGRALLPAISCGMVGNRRLLARCAAGVANEQSAPQGRTGG
jgi:hypothetical protein